MPAPYCWKCRTRNCDLREGRKNRFDRKFLANDRDMIEIPAVQRDRGTSMDLPHLTLRFRTDGRNSGSSEGALFADPFLRVRAAGLRPEFRLLESARRIVGLCGRPEVENRFDDNAVADRLTAGNAVVAAATLGGTFGAFVFDPSAQRLDLISDRFASTKFYWVFRDGQLSVSTSLSRLWDEWGSRGKPNDEAIFEFLYFRRLFGDKTLDSSVRLLPQATVLTVAPGPDRAAPCLQEYWTQDLTPSPLGPRDFAGRIADGLRESVRRQTSDGKRYGLLLSGGLDARAVVAAASVPFHCFTTGPGKNNEYEVAAKLASIAGGPHEFILRPDGLGKYLDEFSALTNGEHMILNGQFFGYGPFIRPHADVLFTGLGLDVFFGGLYQPKRRVAFLGKPSLRFRLSPLSPDITDRFMNAVKYRQKSTSPVEIVKAGRRDATFERLRTTIANLVECARQLSDDPYQCWEWMHMQPFSRHYSFSMLDSIRTFAECRTPALDNDMFDLALSMPATFKANWEVYKAAINRLSPPLMNVRNANSNVRARHSQMRQSATLFGRAAANRYLGTRFRLSPTGEDRSWEAPADFISRDTEARNAVLSLPKSDHLADIDFLDMVVIGRLVSAQYAGEADHSSLLLHLLAIERHLAS